MKKLYLSILIALPLLLASCNEKVSVDVHKPKAPILLSFSPASGPAGTLINVKGENLQNITKATINGGEVVVKSRISSKEMIVQATNSGTTGRLAIISAQGQSSSDEDFTYTYPVPAITTYPDVYMVGGEVVFLGNDLNGVLSVMFKDQKAEIVAQTGKELIVKVPDLRDPSVDITFAYFNGTQQVTLVKEDVSLLREVPQVNVLSSTQATIGDVITATGLFLNLVEKITFGDIELRITTKPENGETISFRLGDDPSLVDGDNIKALTIYSFAGTEILPVEDNFKLNVPKFYTWRNANLNAHSTAKSNHFFCLDSGITYTADEFATDVDPLTMSLSGKVCEGKNQLATSVTQEQYYGVKPYIFFMYMGSGSYLYGPANNNNRISNFKTSATGNPPVLLSGSAYGAPIIIFRTLSAQNVAENAIIQKIVDGTFTSDDFVPGLLDDIDFVKIGTTTEDGWSNVPNGEFGAFKAASATNHRPWAPGLTAAAQNTTIEPNTVALVLYFKPNWEVFVADKTNIRKFGFIHIKSLSQDSTTESGRQNNATMDIYWQRSPMP